MAVVERRLHDRKELWFPYLVCKNNEFFAWRKTDTAVRTANWPPLNMTVHNKFRNIIRRSPRQHILKYVYTFSTLQFTPKRTIFDNFPLLQPFLLLFKTISAAFLFFLHRTAAMLVPLNKETAAMLVSQTDRRGIEFYSYANVPFCFG